MWGWTGPPGACGWGWTDHSGEEAQCLEVLQDVAGLGGDQQHVQPLQRLVHVAHTLRLHKGVLLARPYQLRKGPQETLHSRPRHLHKLTGYQGWEEGREGGREGGGEGGRREEGRGGREGGVREGGRSFDESEGGREKGRRWIEWVEERNRERQEKGRTMGGVVVGVEGRG